MTVSAGTFFGYQQKILYCKQWIACSESTRAVVLIVHGLAEHLERYEYIANYLTTHSISVISYDLRGHGKTDPNAPGFISEKNGFELLVNDLDYVYRQVQSIYPDMPLILFGHSMGSFIIQRFMQLFDHRPAGLIYSGSNGKPPVSLIAGIPVSYFIKTIFGPSHISRFIHYLVFGAYNRKFKPNRTEADWLSRDQNLVDLYVEDPKCGFISTISLYHQLFVGLRTLHGHKPFADHDPDIPVLLIAGDRDPVSNMGRGIINLEELLYSSGIKQITRNLYPGGRHEMLNETNRKEVINDILAWITNYIFENN